MSTTRNVLPSIEPARKSFTGQLLLPGEAGFDDARKLHNGLINKRPAVIARCKGTADIVDAVNLGRTHGLEIAIRGGGHNVAGFASVDNGLMIDLSPMKCVYVDAKARTARVQGGATWGEFNRETQLHGLATTGGVISTTGIAGLTLGGGLGWLMPKYGMALDNLLSAEVVTADGKVVRASKRQNPDLFWALRGGGGNFGVVSSFEFRLHRVGPMITGGLVAHPFEKARDVLRFYRDATRKLPDEMMVFAGLVHSPDGSGAKLAALVVCHCGSPRSGEAAIKRFKNFGTPVMDALGPISYTAINGMLDDGFPKGALNYWKSSFLEHLSDDAIDTLVDCFASCPTTMGSILLEHFHGAVCRVKKDASAFPHRIESYNLAIIGEWIAPADTEKCIAWTRDTYNSIRPFMAQRRYVNYMGEDEDSRQVTNAFGANIARLRKVKSKYDPKNLFHLNQNIKVS